MEPRRTCKVSFANEKIAEQFNALRIGKGEERLIHKWICKALLELEHDPWCGIRIPRRIIPEFYDVKDIWKYDLPKNWRLIYTIEANQVEVLAIVLEWFDHAAYAKRFKY